ncbi:MAG TPA: hypothetical protein VED87_05450 [Methylocystis sp.]|nr:hypothetical protein [Methylocystis sp.]
MNFSEKRTSAVLTTGVLVALYALAVVTCLVLCIALLQSGALGMISIVFYRGLAALALAGCLTGAALALLIRRLPNRLALTARDGFNAGLIAYLALMAVYAVGPTAADRSLSIFILSQVERTQAPMTKEAARDAFVEIYVNEWDQVGRRLSEQEISGNLERTPSGWRLTKQGESFMRFARFLALTFDTDPRITGLKVPPRPTSQSSASAGNHG